MGKTLTAQLSQTFLGYEFAFDDSHSGTIPNNMENKMRMIVLLFTS